MPTLFGVVRVTVSVRIRFRAKVFAYAVKTMLRLGLGLEQIVFVLCYNAILNELQYLSYELSDYA